MRSISRFGDDEHGEVHFVFVAKGRQLVHQLEGFGFGFTQWLPVFLSQVVGLLAGRFNGRQGVPNDTPWAQILLPSLVDVQVDQYLLTVAGVDSGCTSGGGDDDRLAAGGEVDLD
jgi:hypothetical protein